MFIVIEYFLSTASCEAMLLIWPPDSLSCLFVCVCVCSSLNPQVAPLRRPAYLILHCCTCRPPENKITNTWETATGPSPYMRFVAPFIRPRPRCVCVAATKKNNSVLKQLGGSFYALSLASLVRVRSRSPHNQYV